MARVTMPDNLYIFNFKSYKSKLRVLPQLTFFYGRKNLNMIRYKGSLFSGVCFKERVNDMNLLKRLKRIILSAGIEEEEYRSVAEEINISNQKTVVLFSAVVLFILCCLYTASFFADGISQNRSIYGGFLPLVLLTCFLAYKLGKTHKKIMFLITYLFLGVILMIGIMIGTVLEPTEITATFIAVMLTAPQLFTDRPWHMYVMLGCISSLFIYMALKFKDPITWSSDITNTLVFGVLSAIVCSYTITIRVARFRLERTIRMMAEFDQLTGLKNRNSYEGSLEKVSDWECEKVYCSYIDVNGLHELNNVEGHDAGDRMLKYVADAILTLFDKENVYRVGGDEFVILGTDMEVPEIESRIVRIREIVEAEDYHIAVGICCEEKEHLDLAVLIKKAEQMMYQDKRDFYKKSGNDRRRPRM